MANLLVGTAAINAPGPTRTFYLMGHKAAVSYPPLTTAWYPWFSPHSSCRERKQGIPATTREIPVPAADPHVEQLRNFCAAMRGEAELLLSGTTARATLAVLMEVIHRGDASMRAQNVTTWQYSNLPY